MGTGLKFTMKLKHGAKYGRARAIGGWTKSKNGIVWGENGVKSRTSSSSSRLFEDELKSTITKAVEKAAIAGAGLAQSQLMILAKQKYEESGLEEHELTGNTRTSITSAMFSKGKRVGVFGNMPDTPEATGPMLSMKGDSRLRIRGNYKYFLVRRYKSDKYVLYPYWKVQDTSGRYASAEVREELEKEGGNKHALVEIKIAAMTEAYRPELATMMYSMQPIVQQHLYEAIKFYAEQRIEWNRNFAKDMAAFRAAKRAK